MRDPPVDQWVHGPRRWRKALNCSGATGSPCRSACHGGRDLHGPAPAVAHVGDDNTVARLQGGQPSSTRRRQNRVPVNMRDRVARLKTGAVTGTARLHLTDDGQRSRPPRRLPSGSTYQPQSEHETRNPRLAAGGTGPGPGDSGMYA